MTRRSKVWLVAGVLFMVGNVAGGVVAAAQRELLHASMHAGLVLLSASLIWRLAPRRYALHTWRPGGSVNAALSREFADRLMQLEQALEAVAIEVERIGEGQRFMTSLFTDSGALRAPREVAPEPIEIKAQEAAPHVRSS